MKYLRLKKRKDFQKIIKSGKRVYGRTLAVNYLPSDSLKMAVCVGKKHGKSVKRNRIKRLLREAFRQEIPACRFSFLLIPKVAENYSYEEFRQDIKRILTKERIVETQRS